MLFSLHVAVATNLLELFSPILHFQESNVRVYPVLEKQDRGAIK
jgi:hypothetical protein